MYYVERSAYRLQTRDGEANREYKRDIAKLVSEGAPEILRETGRDSKGNRIWRIHESVSDTPSAPGALYAQNDRFIEFRTPFDERRGGIAAFEILILFSFILGNICFVGNTVIMGMIQREDLDLISYIARTFTVILSVFYGAFHILCLYLVSRLETLVQRRLLVRFDRINRKVYVHRPRYAGGVVTLDWDKVITVELNVSQTGSPLFLDWYPIDTPNGLNELLMVGRRTRYGTEYRDVWEFIRRYMEDGPSSVPYQKLLGKIPWPWRALQMTLGTLWEMVRSAPLPAQIVVTLILLPVALVFALWQWISLLLCWEPVFPRKIRAACGESFMAVVRTRIIDLVAWTMLGGAFWLMWPNIKMVMRDCGCEFL